MRFVSYSATCHQRTASCRFTAYPPRSQISDGPSRAETGNHRRRVPASYTRTFQLQRCFPGTATIASTQARLGCIQALRATLDLGFAVGSARASLNINVAIPSIFRRSVRTLFNRIDRWPPTYAHLVWQNADPGSRARQSLAVVSCPPRGPQPIRSTSFPAPGRQVPSSPAWDCSSTVVRSHGKSGPSSQSLRH